MPDKSWGFGPFGVSKYGPDDNWEGAGPPNSDPPAPPPPPPISSVLPAPPITFPTSTTSSTASISGSFSTTYMTNGQPGVSFTIGKSCNNNNGCNSGETSAGTWTNRCYDHDSRHLQGTVCISPSPTSACPAIGTVSSAQYYGPNNQVASSGASNPSGVATLKCVYSSITNPFDTTTVSAFTGTGASDLTGTNGMQKKIL